MKSPLVSPSLLCHDSIRREYILIKIAYLCGALGLLVCTTVVTSAAPQYLVIMVLVDLIFIVYTCMCAKHTHSHTWMNPQGTSYISIDVFHSPILTTRISVDCCLRSRIDGNWEGMENVTMDWKNRTEHYIELHDALYKLHSLQDRIIVQLKHPNISFVDQEYIELLFSNLR